MRHSFLASAIALVAALSSATAYAQAKKSPCIGNLVDPPNQTIQIVNSLDMTSLMNAFGTKISAKTPPLVQAADLNADGVVDNADLGILLSNWGVCLRDRCPGDYTNDGKVDSADLGVVLSGLSGDGLTFSYQGGQMDSRKALMSVFSNWGRSCSKLEGKVSKASPLAQSVGTKQK